MNDPTPPSAPKKRRPSVRKRRPSKKVEGKGSVEAPAVTDEAPVPAVETATADATPEPAPVVAKAEPAAPPPATAAVELIRVPMSVRWRDLDAFNHVNNSKYLSYLEEARLRWMMTLPGMGLEDSTAPVVAASNLNYRRPIGWPNEVCIELFVERLGNTSVTVGHRIASADSSIVYCDGNVVMVWIDRETGRAAQLPEAVRRACRPTRG